MADIMIVDDEPNNCSLLEQYLARANHKTISCYSGMDACRKVRTSNFDLIFMDIHMPDMDGIATIRRLRLLGYTGKIIIVTADPRGENARAGAQAGANGFLAKPVMSNINEIIDQFVVN